MFSFQCFSFLWVYRCKQFLRSWELFTSIKFQGTAPFTSLRVAVMRRLLRYAGCFILGLCYNGWVSDILFIYIGDLHKQNVYKCHTACGVAFVLYLEFYACLAILILARDCCRARLSRLAAALTKDILLLEFDSASHDSRATTKNSHLYRMWIFCF